MTSWLLRVSCALLLGLASLATQAVPRFEDVRQAYTSSEALLLDRRGEPIERLRVDASVRRGDWVPLAAISPALRHALVLSEDRRFYEHSGVDWRAVGAAACAPGGAHQGVHRRSVAREGEAARAASLTGRSRTRAPRPDTAR